VAIPNRLNGTERGDEHPSPAPRGGFVLIITRKGLCRSSSLHTLPSGVAVSKLCSFRYLFRFASSVEAVRAPTETRLHFRLSYCYFRCNLGSAPWDHPCRWLSYCSSFLFSKESEAETMERSARVQIKRALISWSNTLLRPGKIDIPTGMYCMYLCRAPQVNSITKTWNRRPSFPILV